MLQGLIPDKERYPTVVPSRFALSFAAVGEMKSLGTKRPALFLVVAFAGACSISDAGLGPAQDASSTTGPAACPAGITDRANWPANTAFTSCAKTCGPDGTGVRSCSQSDRAACQAAGGCVCLEPPCVSCGNCAFRAISDCYVPTNTDAIPACGKEVSQGSPCGPACGRQLCLEADGKTGCVCNAQNQYACATWGETTWK